MTTATAGLTVELVVGPRVVHEKAVGREVDHDGMDCARGAGVVVVAAVA